MSALKKPTIIEKIIKNNESEDKLILNFDRIKESIKSELILMPDNIESVDDIRNFILSHGK